MFPYITLFHRTIPTYGLFLTAGLLTACALAMVRASREGRNRDHLLIIAAVAFGCGLVGAKLLYILVTYPLQKVWTWICAFDFSFLQESGLVFYGGLAAGILGAIWGAKIAGARLLDYEAVIVPCIPIGHAIGRIGCLAAGCCRGVAYDGFLAVYYPGIKTGFFPVQLLEAAANLAVAGVLMLFAGRKRERLSMILLYLTMYAVERFCLEFLRGDPERGVFLIFSTSQWISLALGAVCLVLYLGRRSWKGAPC
ncbi:MAG TPA: prolipoprotein diacylglyceryl transferase [Candidatus Faecousia intestinigallinarum]|nr:prolipoprotein diacylglyceryl transferase [Candidatus Faecousia intestinigallinarum]